MTVYLTKLRRLDHQINNPIVHQQEVEVEKIIKTVASQKVLMTAPAKLGLLPDKAAEIGQQCSQPEQVKTINHLLNALRQYLSLHFGIWSLPNMQTAFLIKQQFKAKKVLEIMAGNAYWTEAFARTNLQVIATDSSEWAKTSLTGQRTIRKVHHLSAELAIKNYRQADLILCSWAPNFGQADLKAVMAWHRYNPNSHLLFVGEKGVTNSNAFWQKVSFKKSKALLLVNRSFTSFDFIHEHFFEVKDL